jgi:putative ABC transport system permease protein
VTLRNIALNNLRRRKTKAIFVLAGLVIGVSTVVALLTLVDTMKQDINHKLEMYGANILIVPKTENLSLSYGGLSLGGVSFDMNEIRETELERIRTIKNTKNIAAVGPMVLGPVKADSRGIERGNLHSEDGEREGEASAASPLEGATRAPAIEQRVLMAGVDFQAFQMLRPWWNVKGTIPEGEAVLLGSDAARVLGARAGSSLNVNGRPFSVSGVLEATGSQDDGLIFAPLSTAQSLLHKEGRISMVEVAALCSGCPIADMVDQISQVLPGANVMGIQQVVKGRMETLGHFQKFSYGVSALVLLVGSLMVFITMMGSVRERTVEIGILSAMGFRRNHVIRIILFEAAIIAGIAGILGYLLGFAGTKALLPFFAEGHAHVAVPLDPLVAGAAFLLALALGLASSIYPAVVASRLDPNEALRAL